MEAYPCFTAAMKLLPKIKRAPSIGPTSPQIMDFNGRLKSDRFDLRGSIRLEAMKSIFEKMARETKPG